jgi:hypothetical protein
VCGNLLEGAMNAQQVAQALGNASRTSGGWTCRCPAHDDSTPSLSLSDGADGRLLWHCHAHCSQNDVLLALQDRGLLDPLENGDARGRDEYAPVVPAPSAALSPASYEHPQRGKPDQLWVYHQAQGDIAGAVARWDLPGDKIIRPLTYCTNGVGPPAWREKGIPSPRPLYRLPQLVAAAGLPVLVVEGEKAADAAAELFKSHAVTTPPHGAKSPHLANWSPVAGRDVVVWPDHDEAGLAYADRVAELATAAGARSVRIVPVPVSFPEKWDLADPVPEGADLNALLASAIEWRHCEPSSPKPDDWPEPDMSIVSTHREPAPPFPVDVFGKFWGEWLGAAAEAKGAPVDYIGNALLSATGMLLSTARWAIAWAGWREPPIIWTANIGLPSTNKSPAGDGIAEPVRTIEAELNEMWPDRLRAWKTEQAAAEVRKRAWQEELNAAVKQGGTPPRMPADAEEPERVHLRRLVITDVTPEKVVRLSAVNSHGLLLIRDELAGWFGGMDRYGGNGSERALWLEAYGGRPYQMDRVKDDKPIRTRMLAVCITGGIQPDRLASMILNGDDDGLAARLIYAWPEPRPPKRPTRFIDNLAAHARLRRLSELTDLTDLSEPAYIPLSGEAADLLQQWRQEVAEKEKAASGLFLSWLGKLPGTAIRLALILEHLWWVGERFTANPPETVSPEAMTAAVGYLDSYAIPMARRAFGDAALPQVVKDAAAIARWLLAQDPLPEVVNARNLRKAAVLSGIKEAERYDAALGELGEAGWLRDAPARAGRTLGRRRKDWQVNPQLGARP